VQGDVSQEQDILEMLNAVIDQFDRFDILINNAGIQTEYASHEIPTEEFDRVLSINLRGVFLCARETIKHFLSQNRSGITINASSVHEAISQPLHFTYSISKGGMGNLTRTLALKYKAIALNHIQWIALEPQGKWQPQSHFTHRIKLHTSLDKHYLLMVVIDGGQSCCVWGQCSISK
jgi:NAD(P)-dependent dehydrogenase (short-subunit alcohol dehydrogenase family)